MKLLLIGGCGYVGSCLYEAFKADGRQIDTLDLEKRGNFVNPDNIKMDYAEVTAQFLAKYDVILWFAGHSGSEISQEDPAGALQNNMLHLFALQQKLSPEQRLIYASTATVYNAISGDAVQETENRFNPTTAYDISRFALDAMMGVYGDNFAALRLGSVGGASANMRFDLIVNAMVRSALVEGRVRVSNEEKRRALLGMGDLVQAVRVLVGAREMEAGLYNLASFNTTIGEIGKKVAERLGVPLEKQGGRSAYGYQIDVQKFCRRYDFTFKDTLPSLIDQVAQKVRGAELSVVAGHLRGTAGSVR